MAKVLARADRRCARRASSPSEPWRAQPRAHGSGSTASSQRSAPRSRDGWGESYGERVHEKGKLDARERVERLRDPGSPVLPIGTLRQLRARVRRAATSPGAGVVTAFVRVAGPLDRGHRQRQHGRLGLVVAADAGEDPARAGDGAAPAPAGRLPRRLLGPVPARAVAHLPRRARAPGHIFKHERAALRRRRAADRRRASATASPAAATCRSSATSST